MEHDKPQPGEVVTRPTVDSQISLADSRAYWESVNADNDGMLGGFEEVTASDLKESKTFFIQVQQILGNNKRSVQLAVDCGAGIGRITKGLLVNIARKVDVVEPIAKFAAEIEKSTYKEDGRVDEIFVQGLEDWSPPTEKKYDVIWNQWCLGHLTDGQLVEYLQRAAKGLVESNGEEKGEKGWILVKENITSDDDEDLFDIQDSSVTRSDQKFRQIFKEANLNLVRAKRQKRFPEELYAVMMYALRPKT